MLYIFIINGREDKSFVYDEVMRQIGEVGSSLQYMVYRTRGVGDGTRFVRIYWRRTIRIED